MRNWRCGDDERLRGFIEPADRVRSRKEGHLRSDHGDPVTELVPEVLSPWCLAVDLPDDRTRTRRWHFLSGQWMSLGSPLTRRSTQDVKGDRGTAGKKAEPSRTHRPDSPKVQALHLGSVASPERTAHEQVQVPTGNCPQQGENRSPGDRIFVDEATGPEAAGGASSGAAPATGGDIED